MRTVKTQRKRLKTQSIILRLFMMACVTLTTIPVEALETEPHPLDTFLTNILNFKNPTGIRGTFRYIDLEGQIVWLNWRERSDDRPYFLMGGSQYPAMPPWRSIHKALIYSMNYNSSKKAMPLK